MFVYGQLISPGVFFDFFSQGICEALRKASYARALAHC